MSQSGRVPDTHAEAWALLPFLVNGRIASQDREWVEAHVHTCDDCRRELEAQRPLAQEMRESEAPFASSEQRAFAKLWTRIEASENAMPEDERAVPMRATGAAPRRTVRWLAAAVFVQAIGLALLGGIAVKNSDDSAGDFRTVTSVEGRQMGPAVRLVFTPDTSMRDVTQILSGQGLELVAGPHGAGIFTAAVADASVKTSAEAIAKSLRENAQVQFAEPVASQLAAPVGR
jgi:hypothetical protein